MTWTVKTLRAFENTIAGIFEEGKLHCPIHFSGGNEKDLIAIFKNIKKEDYVFSTHRNHYHFLLKGGDPKDLLNEMTGKKTAINKGQARSMNVCDPRINFYTSAIVGGNCAIAVGVAMALKKEERTAEGGRGKKVGAVRKSSLKNKRQPWVWCFVGDGAEDQGHFLEAVRFGLSRNLPLTFIVEDNDMSTDSTKKDRWHNYQPVFAKNILRYTYQRIWPHVGMGKRVTF